MLCADCPERPSLADNIQICRDGNCGFWWNTLDLGCLRKVLFMVRALGVSTSSRNNMTLQSSVLTLCRTCGRLDVGGYAYPHIPFHWIDRASVTIATRYWYGDTYTSILLLKLVANKSSIGLHNSMQICWNTIKRIHNANVLIAFLLQFHLCWIGHLLIQLVH